MSINRGGRRGYPPEFRVQAVELYRSSGLSFARVATDLGVSVASLKIWVKQAEIDAGEREGLVSAEREELVAFRQGERDPVSAFRFIAAEKAHYSVKTMCRVLGVSRAGFYAWLERKPSARARQDEELTRRVREIHTDNRGVYGSPRIHAELRLTDGVRVARKRAERLMRQANISGLTLRKKGRTTIRVPGVRVCEDLVDRNFLASAPNRLWVADITYLRTWEGWLYLAAVQDAYSRRIVGWSMADHMRTELVTDALQMALERRSPGPGLIHHSDRGGQYVSLALGQNAGAAGIAQSMGSRGDCFDNAVAESFFATLKKELIHRRAWPTKAELRGEVFEYIEVFYNRRRRHTRLGQLSPSEYERITHEQHQPEAIAA